MSSSGLESFEHTVQLTHIWIKELEEKLGWEDSKPRAYRLLKTTLHALRDSLPLNEMAHFGAQLPTLLRGAYYEQWRPMPSPRKKMTKDELVGRVNEAFTRDPLPNTVRAIMAVFELLSKKVTSGEVADVRHALPGEIRTLWPEPYVAPGVAVY